MGFLPHPSDPFYELMKPPEDETPAQKTARLTREADAQRINDSIEDKIKEDRAKMKQEKDIVRLLLLGQSESGKSTILKNFRIRFARAEWEKERNGWRSVVHLNVVHAVNALLRVLEAEMNKFQSEGDGGNTDESMKFTDRHQQFINSLAPLAKVEADLEHRLGAFSYTPASAPQYVTPFDDGEDVYVLPKRREFSVRSWKDLLEPDAIGAADMVSSTLSKHKEDMKALWNDPVVRLAVKKRRLQLGDTAGFFLNDLDRIANRNYSITDDDIVRARLRTVGIQEYRIIFKSRALEKAGLGLGWEWRIFDVGGCRTSRRAWLPYFENVNVIIFVSPVSVFDQRLEEESSVNRFEDSILLWTAICSSQLLAKTQLILFLNKCDLLRRKLKRGVKVKDFLPSFGDRENDLNHVVKYFHEKFKDILKLNSPTHRQSYIYPTTATDTAQTGQTLSSVRDIVLRENLLASSLI